MNSAGLKFVSDIGRRITQVSKDNRERAFLFQRLSVLIQRFNSVAIRGTFAHTPTEEQVVVFGRYRDLLSGRVLRQRSHTREAGAAAEVAASHKEDKYADLDSRYLFEPIAFVTLGVLNSSVNSLLKEIGNKISLNTESLGRSASYISVFRC